MNLYLSQVIPLRSNELCFQGMTGPPGVAGPQGPSGHNVCSAASSLFTFFTFDFTHNISYSFHIHISPIHFTQRYSLAFAMQGLPGRPGEKGSPGEPVSPSLLLYC